MHTRERDEFLTKLFTWWESNRRDLPWRRTTEPYHIMVSEFMLQQTQVTRVIPKYKAFIRHFPDIDALASAPLGDVLTLWSGLGYNRRAKWLREAAQQISEMGDFPLEPGVLIRLKGVGRYTSRSIPVFATNADLVAVDANVRKVLLHEGFITPSARPREVEEVALSLLPRGRSRDFHNAIMDYGALKVGRIGGLRNSSASQFSGSTRQLRGAVLREVIERGPLTLQGLERKFSDSRLLDVLNSLVDEGILCTAKSLFFVEGQSL